MSDGSPRRRLAGRLFLVLLLAMLAGCSTWFAPPRPTPAEDPELNIIPTEPAAAEPVPQASAPVVSALPREAPEHKRAAPKPPVRPPRTSL